MGTDKDEDTTTSEGGVVPVPVPKTSDPYTHPDSDFALALALQHQESTSSSGFTLESSESESESESERESDIVSNHQEFLHSQGVLEFLEEEDTNSDQDMEEDDIDPDELSYEELIALGEIVGEESKGLSPDEISSSLHPSVFYPFPPTTTTTTTTTIVDRCVICQVDYKEGEKTVGLIPCDHPYHLDCITTWLLIRKICPICSSEVSSK